MYNEEIKNEFIDYAVKEGTSQNIQVVARRYFTTVEAYEQSIDKDLANFTITEIIGMFKYVCTCSLEVIMQMTSLFSRYTYYCKENGFVADGINHYDEVTYDVMKACTNTKRINDSIISRKDLLKLANTLPNPSDRFLILAIFEGLSGKGMSDLITLELSQFKNGKVHLASGRVLTISKELLSFAEESAATYEYYSDKAYNMYYKADDTRILKDFCNTKEDTELDDRGRVNLMNKLARLRRRNENNALTHGHLVQSGRIHMIQTFMKEDKTKDLRKCLSDHKDEITIRYNKITSQNRFIVKYSDYFNQQ